MYFESGTKWVLLGGDTDIVPIKEGNTDNYGKGTMNPFNF